MKKSSFVSVLFCVFCLTTILNANNYTLTPLSTFGIYSDGSVRPGDQAWVSLLSNQRGMGVDPVTTNVVFVNTGSGSGGSAAVQGTIEIVNADTGAEITTLNTNGMFGGNYSDAPAAVADDGSVYVANQVTDSGANPLRIYRWPSVTSTDPPTPVFAKTITPPSRYGINMDARGSGTGVQLLMGSSAISGGVGTNVVIFTTSIESVGSSANAMGAVAIGGVTSYPANDTVALKVYAFRTVTNAGVRIYSPTSADATAVTSNDVFTVNWTWDAVSGAEGYRLLRNSNSVGYVEHVDVTNNSYSDTNGGWIAGATVTPSTGPYLTANVLATDSTNNNFTEGVSFGVDDSFWAKQSGAPLKYMGFSLATSNATTLASYPSSTWSGSSPFSAIAVDTNRNLLCAMDAPASVISTKYVRLYDISDTNKPPLLLDIEPYTYTPAASPGTAPPANAHFGGSGARLYTHVMNNGLMAFSVDSVATPPPSIFSRPAATNRIAAGASITFSVTAFPAITGYQWKSNGVAIAGATNESFTLVNAQINFAAVYSCVVTNDGGSTNLNSTLQVVNPSDLFHLSLLWRVGPSDGKAWMTVSGANGVPNQRTLGYNALSNHLYVISRSGNTTSNYVVYVLNATNGALLYTLNTNGIYKAGAVGEGGIGLVGIGVADDGSIYACNEAPDACGCGGAGTVDSLFRIYRWANADSNTTPVQVFSGDPASQGSPFRWGDNLAVRGSGPNTQILIDSNTREASNTKRKVAILVPTDGTLTSFTNYWIQGDNMPSAATSSTTPPTGQNPAAIGKSLEFDPDVNGYWQKFKSGWLVQNTFDTNTPGGGSGPNISYSVGTIISNGFGNGVYGLGISKTLNLAAGVSTNGTLTVPDKLNLYDISTPSSPLLLAQYSFPASPANANGNFISQTFFASNSVYTNIVFTISANNGIMAFRVASGPLPPPSFSQNPNSLRLLLGGSGTMSVQTFEPDDLQWQKDSGSGFTNVVGQTNSTFTFTSAQLSDAGTYRVLATNVFQGGATSAVATVAVLLPENNYFLSPTWTLPPDAQPYVTSSGGASTPNERCIAYDPVHKLLWLTRKNANNNYGVLALDPNTGSLLFVLNTNGITMNIPAFAGTTGAGINAVAVSDDGALYMCNMTGDACGCSNVLGTFKIYRWANAADSNTPPVVIFQGDPANQSIPLRWGDVLDVRGSGLNTEIILDNNAGTFVTILKPANASLTTFTNVAVPNLAGAGLIGRSLQWGFGNTYWQKRKQSAAVGGPVRNSSYNLATQTSASVASYDVFPATLGGVGLEFGRYLLAGVDFVGTAGVSPDVVNLYEVADFTQPVLLGTYPFPTNKIANANFISQTIFGGKKVFSLQGNNGLVAFEIGGRELTIDHTNGVNEVVISWYTNMTANYVLQTTDSLNPTNWVNEGSTPVVDGIKFWVTNSISTNKLYRLRR